MVLEDHVNISVMVASVATTLGVIIALVVYISNSKAQDRQRVVENVVRFQEAHARLFQNEFLSDNLQAMEEGTFARDLNDKEMERHFSRLLGDIEYFALLQKAGAISRTMNVYMFGWFAQRIQPVLTSQERSNVYWQLAVEFLDEMKKEADEFSRVSPEERREYFQSNHFSH
jgi:hypothetical protein